jgi:hypothetical protein
MLFLLILIFPGRVESEPGRGKEIHGHSHGTIGVEELSHRVLEESLRLQQAGLNAIRREDYETAVRIFQRALELTPSSLAIYNNIGVCEARRYRVGEAAAWFEKARDMAPFDPLIAGNLGLMRWLQHRTDESYELLAVSISRGGATSAAQHYAMGLMELEKGHPSEGIRNLTTVDRNRFPYRDLFLSAAQRNMGRPGASQKSYRRFMDRYRAPWINATY